MSSAVGLLKTALDTPALVVDLDAMAENIGKIARTCSENGIAWRPHTKGQKTPEIAHAEIAAGAIGITCAKLGEAESSSPAAANIVQITWRNFIIKSLLAALSPNHGTIKSQWQLDGKFALDESYT